MRDSRSGSRRAALAMLLLAALLMRVLVPAGWMVGPGHDRVIAISLCNSDATVQIPVPAKSDSVGEDAAESKACSFAAHGSGFAPPDTARVVTPDFAAAAWDTVRLRALSPASVPDTLRARGPPRSA